MAVSRIHSGICGFTTTVTAVLETGGEDLALISIETECELVRRAAELLRCIRVFDAVAGDGVYQACFNAGLHKACPVPVGIVK
ncbi:MAG: DUF6951 family protein, partial [Armatimonadota bacterium]